MRCLIVCPSIKISGKRMNIVKDVPRPHFLPFPSAGSSVPRSERTLDTDGAEFTPSQGVGPLPVFSLFFSFFFSSLPHLVPSHQSVTSRQLVRR